MRLHDVAAVEFVPIFIQQAGISHEANVRQRGRSRGKDDDGPMGGFQCLPEERRPARPRAASRGKQGPAMEGINTIPLLTNEAAGPEAFPSRPPATGRGGVHIPGKQAARKMREPLLRAQ